MSPAGITLYIGGLLNKVRSMGKRKTLLQLFVVSLVSLYFELLIIRWLSSEIRIFAYFKNIPLMACLFGLGLGMALPTGRFDLRRFFPFGLMIIVSLVSLAEPLHLVHITFLNPMDHYLIGDFVKTGFQDTPLNRTLLFVKGLLVLTGVFYLIAFTFMSIGQRLAELFDQLPALIAYSINVAASLCGVLLFSLVSFFGWPPYIWLLIGIAACLPYFKKFDQLLALCACLAIAYAFTNHQAIWSPYYRLSMDAVQLAADRGHPSAKYGYNINVNYDSIEGAYDNSKQFLHSLTDKQLRGTADYYDTPYTALGDAPRSVLILAAGTGNDVAAALRHGALDIDAVEIDPQIAKIGCKLHPEAPYANTKVHLIVDDARAYMERTNKRYDLIVFGYLDSHTAFSSMSSLRLDNYVYTKESFAAAAKLLKPKGIISVTFYYLNWWQLAHVFKALEAGTSMAPSGVFSPMGNGPTLLVGSDLDKSQIASCGLKPFSIDAAANDWGFTRTEWSKICETTDDWPFLFLKNRSVSWTYAVGLLFTLMLGYGLVGACFGKYADDDSGRVMFLLGAAFMLIETKSVTQMGLLLGTTWVVNAAVIAVILLMILGANILYLQTKFSNIKIYFALLVVALAANFFLPIGMLGGLNVFERTLIGSVLLASPLFFAAMIFARVFSQAANPSKALGMNLLGALVGGVLEYLSMIFGVNSLNMLAALLYAAAFLYWLKWSRYQLVNPDRA